MNYCYDFSFGYSPSRSHYLPELLRVSRSYENPVTDHGKVLRQVAQEGNRGLLQSLVGDLAKGCYIQTLFHYLRKTWIPGGHEGSQSDDRDSHEALCNAIIDHIKQERKEMEDYA